MKVFLSLCPVMLFISAVYGQSEPDARLCEGKGDFDLCDGDGDCDLSVSRCFCKSKLPYCRCNNYKNEFYLGENCDQKWTTLTFALVASLPGLTLAVFVGVIVQLVNISQKPNTTTGGESKLQSSSPTEETTFPGVVFASDMKTRPRGPSSGPGQLQGGVTMATTSTRPYSISDSHRPPSDRPPMGDFHPPYSPTAKMHPVPDRPPMGGPRAPSSAFENMPPQSRNSSFNRPILGAQQPYSYTASPGQVLSNPYAKTQNPYEERSSSPDQFRSYSPPSSPQTYDDRRTAPSYGAPDYSNRGGVFPRAQINYY